MKIFMDVTSSCTSVQNTGMQRMSRKIFGELSRRQGIAVRPICWNRIGQSYVELGEPERRYLSAPFRVRARSMSRPDLMGRDPFSELARWIGRRRIDLKAEIGDQDVFLVPDIYRDSRRLKLADFLRQTPARTVAIFHDATDLRLTSVYGDRSRKSRPYVESLSLFDLVICVSEEAERDLHFFWERYGCHRTVSCVEPWPCELEAFGERQVAMAEVPASARGAERLVLYVSSFHGRKNHLLLLHAAERLWNEGLRFQLCLIGKNVGAPLNKIVRQIRALQRRGRPLRWLRHVNDEILLRAYRECFFTVYPSLMEGFGLPIVEGLLHGKPCVCGGNGALGEVARGGGCLVVDQRSEEALAAGIKELLTDRDTYARLCAEARARRFRSWSDYMEKLIEHLQPLRLRAPAGHAEGA